MNHQTKISALLALLWLATGGVLFYAVVILSMSWNLFSWTPDFDLPGILSLATAMVLQPWLFFLVRWSRGQWVRWLGLLVVLALAIFALMLTLEHHNEIVSDAFLGRSVLSPHWFHLLILALLGLPGIFWFYFTLSNT